MFSFKVYIWKLLETAQTSGERQREGQDNLPFAFSLGNPQEKRDLNSIQIKWQTSQITQNNAVVMASCTEGLQCDTATCLETG